MSAAPDSRPVILCIDDRETKVELEVRKRVLEGAGYRVLLATRARRQAMEIFRRHHVDLVLTEQGVAGTIGGPTLAPAMKRFRPDVPVILYSADWAPSHEDIKFADLFITKLVSVDELLRTVEELLEIPAREAA
ncbi:MAG: hypothetical protein DMG66_04315 [Acidobacteria bacterium]|nr:MAG: hypothetical protein DMG66_04315 [Acidobacteriota bacterium]